jgi:hypothetical protein
LFYWPIGLGYIGSIGLQKESFGKIPTSAGKSTST